MTQTNIDKAIELLNKNEGYIYMREGYMSIIDGAFSTEELRAILLLAENDLELSLP